MLDQKIELLQQVPLFAALSEDHLEAIAEAGQKAFFQAGENLIAQGETGNSSYLILSGKAGCTKTEKGEQLVEDLWPGTLVGELAMIVDTVHMVTVTAQEKLRALAFPREIFRNVMEMHPAIAQHISKMLLVRLHGLASELRRVDQKLAELEEAA